MAKSKEEQDEADAADAEAAAAVAAAVEAANAGEDGDGQVMLVLYYSGKFVVHALGLRKMWECLSTANTVSKKTQILSGGRSFAQEKSFALTQVRSRQAHSENQKSLPS